LTNDGRKPGTVENYRKVLAKLLREGADLFDPENTKSVLAKAKMAQNGKRSCAAILNTWFDLIEIKWKRPRYERERKIPWILAERLLDTIIAGLGKKTAAYCQLLKETGARCGEISALTWGSIDFNEKCVYIVPEKGSNPRLLKLSQKALDMIRNIPKTRDHVFANADDMRSCFFMQRRRLAKKLGDSSILKVHFHSFRHWKATAEYHNTKDLIHVQELLGHKNIEITRQYIYIEKQVYKKAEGDKFHTKVATTKEEIVQLLDAGFDHIMTKDGLAYFRKRK
jgi:integrase